MSRHVAARPENIWDELTSRVKEQIEEHPRRYRDIHAGRNIMLHDEFGGEHLGIVNRLDPLEITWRY